MQIQLIEPGWETYTGDLGTVPFENGKSLSGISVREAQSLGAYIHVVEINAAGEHIGRISPSHDMLRMSEVSAQSPKVMKTLKEIQEEAAVSNEASGAAPVKVGAYTAAELEKIASEGGIASIRAIAEPMNIRGTSIKMLIAEILVKQAPE